MKIYELLDESGLDQQAGIGIDGQSFRFSIKDLIALANKYPITKINPRQFEHQLAGREEDPSQSMARAQKAELKYPIIVVKRKNGKLWIADGTHRVHKAMMMDLPTIDAKIIPVEDMGQFLVNETIRKVKGGYRLVSKSGKNLGTYPSKRGAEKRERQVQYFKHVAESKRVHLDFDKLYGKAFKITDAEGDPNKSGFSIVTPSNSNAWTDWKEKPQFKKIVKQKLNDPNFLGDHKYLQIIDAMSQIRENTKEKKLGNFISPPGNTVGLNVFELSPVERQKLNGIVVYHQTKKLDKIMQAGGLRPRADVSGENSFAINDIQSGKDWRTPKGVFVSKTAKNWFGDEIAFKIEPTDKIYRAYHPEQGHILIANPIPTSRFISVNDKPLNEGPIWDKVKKTAAASAVAGAAGYGALTGQFTDKAKEPARAPIEITIPGGDLEQPKPEVKKEKVKLEPSTATNADPKMEKLVFLTAYRSGIKGEELAQFMAQVAHETLGFQRLVEVGNKKYFNKYDPKYSPQKAKILGNVKLGDGERYKGRGFIQITGRYNYRIAGQALGLPLEQNPKLASNPEVAAKIAVWYWKNKVKPKVSDFTDTIGVTSQINPSMNGLGDRDLNFQNYLIRLKPLINKS